MASIYDLFQIDPEEAEAIGYADRLSPAEGLMADRRLFQQRAVRGIEDLGRTALGLPQFPRTDRVSAAAELRALAAKVRPGTPEFFEAAIAILQKYNMPAEAADMEKQRLALETGKGELDPLLKMKRARDLLAKSPDASSPAGQAALAAIDRKIAAYGKPPEKPEKAAVTHEFTKLLNDYKAALDAGETDRAEFLKRRIDAELKKQETSGADVSLLRLELEKQRFEYTKDKDTAKEQRLIDQDMTALQGAIRVLDVEIQSGERLAVHPGVGAITGDWAGALPLAAVAVASKGAAALFRPIEGQIFIRALQDLKATSKTGASGLGQLTEVEGGKIQAARAALDRQQPTAQFLRTLAAYTASLKSARKVAEAILTKHGAAIPTPEPAVIDFPAKSDPRSVTPPAAGPQPRKFRTVK